MSASDTINGHLADLGAILEVSNGSGGSINVTFSDPGKTPAGNAGSASAVAVANGAKKRFKLHSGLVDPATGLITVGFSGTTSVTYELYY